MNRIDERFAALKANGKKGFVVYIGAGDPSLKETVTLAVSFDAMGVDVLELGIPFSDPLADGLVNQLAAQRGLASGTTPIGVLDCVAEIRKSSSIPIVLYVYFNLLHRYGVEKFIQRAAASGVDGLLVLDLPPEESGRYGEWMKASGLAAIFLVAPTTPDERITEIVRHGSGFIYYVSREGVTGMQKEMSQTIASMTEKIRSRTPLPIAIGFGISTVAQAEFVARHGDAIVVGSAVVNQIALHGRSGELSEQVRNFTQPLIQAVKKI